MAGDRLFYRLAGWAALGAATLALIYAVAFLAGYGLAAWLALMLGGLLSTVAVLALYQLVAEAGGLARLGLLFGVVGTLGAAVHGAYEVGLGLSPGLTPLADGGVFQADPRGFLSFGVSGLGLALLSGAGLNAGRLSRNLLYLGVVLGLLSIAIYLGRLVIVDASNIIVVALAGLTGLIVAPLWYGWLGYRLLSEDARAA
jgi:hypothetical protein